MRWVRVGMLSGESCSFMALTPLSDLPVWSQLVMRKTCALLLITAIAFTRRFFAALVHNLGDFVQRFAAFRQATAEIDQIVAALVRTYRAADDHRPGSTLLRFQSMRHKGKVMEGPEQAVELTGGIKIVHHQLYPPTAQVCALRQAAGLLQTFVAVNGIQSEEMYLGHALLAR